MMTVYSQSETSITPSTKKKTYIHSIGVEAGFRGFTPGNNEYDFIRQGPTSFPYYDDGYNGSYGETISTSFISVIAEYRFPSDRFWLSTGIKYTSMHSKISNADNTNNETDFFYVLLNKDLNNTYYYRVKEISEQNNYIGVPLDLSYSPFLPRFFRLYFKVGFDFNFKISTKRNVDFQDAKMENNEDRIINLFDKPNNFYATSTVGVGFQLGRQGKPNIRIEANLPAVILTSKASGLIDHNVGGGAKISFFIPLKN